MCELLGMSANVPTDICFSFSGLMQRGGATGPHKDGWGIVFYEQGGTREFRDHRPSVDSEIAQLVSQYPIKSETVISHIRQANVGDVNLVNTHPFCREMWGQYWTFAHNGQLKDYQPEPVFYQPVGTTDSEAAFCHLMDEMRQKCCAKQVCAPFNGDSTDHAKIWQLIADFGRQRMTQGVFNMLLSQGEFLICFCGTNLHWLTRRAPFGVAELSDAEMRVNFKKETTPRDIVTVVATQPLTQNEQWQKMNPGEIIVFAKGEPIWQQAA